MENCNSFKFLHGKLKLPLSSPWLAAIFIHIIHETTSKELHLSISTILTVLKDITLHWNNFGSNILAFFSIVISVLTGQLTLYCCCWLSAMTCRFRSPLCSLCVCTACSAFPVNKVPDCCHTNCFIQLWNRGHCSAFTRLLTEGGIATYFTVTPWLNKPM